MGEIFIRYVISHCIRVIVTKFTSLGQTLKILLLPFFLLRLFLFGKKIGSFIVSLDIAINLVNSLAIKCECTCQFRTVPLFNFAQPYHVLTKVEKKKCSHILTQYSGELGSNFTFDHTLLFNEALLSAKGLT